jgi:hypothetical protein
LPVLRTDLLKKAVKVGDVGLGRVGLDVDFAETGRL